MGSSEMASQQQQQGQGDSVKVAVNVRPLITQELLLGCTDCVTVTPGEPQVRIIRSLGGPPTAGLAQPSQHALLLGARVTD
jgi:hypothetical protein